MQHTEKNSSAKENECEISGTMLSLALARKCYKNRCKTVSIRLLSIKYKCWTIANKHLKSAEIELN